MGSALEPWILSRATVDAIWQHPWVRGGVARRSPLPAAQLADAQLAAKVRLRTVSVLKQPICLQQRSVRVAAALQTTLPPQLAAFCMCPRPFPGTGPAFQYR